jgi:hypothetical protein
VSFFSRLTHPTRVESPELETPEQIDAFIDSRALEYPTKIEDDFVQRALGLGVGSGMILDVGTRVGLILLKMLWQNENFYAIGMDASGLLIERAHETAQAWDLADRAFFQVGDARKMRLKTAYFGVDSRPAAARSFPDAAKNRSVFCSLRPAHAAIRRDRVAGSIHALGTRSIGASIRPRTGSNLRIR